MKRVLSFALALAMCVSLLPTMQVFAAEEQTQRVYEFLMSADATNIDQMEGAVHTGTQGEGTEFLILDLTKNLYYRLNAAGGKPQDGLFHNPAIADPETMVPANYYGEGNPAEPFYTLDTRDTEEDGDPKGTDPWKFISWKQSNNTFRMSKQAGLHMQFSVAKFGTNADSNYAAIKLYVDKPGKYLLSMKTVAAVATYTNPAIYFIADETSFTNPSSLKESDKLGYFKASLPTAKNYTYIAEVEITEGDTEYLLVFSPDTTSLAMNPPAETAANQDLQLRGVRLYPSDSDYLAGLELSAESSVLEVNETTTISVDELWEVKGNTGKADLSEIAFSTNRPSAISVSADGVVTALGVTSEPATITATHIPTGKTGSISVSVNPIDYKKLRTIEITGEWDAETGKYAMPSFVLNSSVPQTKYCVKGLNAIGEEIDLSEAGIVWSLDPEGEEGDTTYIANLSQNGKAAGLTLINGSTGEDKLSVTVTLDDVTLTETKFVIVHDGKSRRSLFSDEMIANAVENSAKYSWARGIKNQHIKDSNNLLVPGIDFLWNHITSQDLPRSVGVARPSSDNRFCCPFCGDMMEEYGQYPFTANFLTLPWKISCLQCKEIFPTNDFASFYELGRISEEEATDKFPANGGKFNRITALEKHREMLIGKGLLSSEALALTSPGADGSETWKLYYGYGVEGGYLYNEIHRDIYPKDDPSAVIPGGKAVTLTGYETVDRWMVDDGLSYNTGRVAANGTPEEFFAIAYYNHIATWYPIGSIPTIVKGGLTSLGNAYIYLGAENGGEEARKYAVAAAILLDRIADVYPELDVGAYYNKYGKRYGNCDGGSYCGGMVGRIWEGNLLGEIAEVYDMIYPIYDDPEVIEYLNAKAEEWGIENKKQSSGSIRKNIEENLLKQAFETFKTAKAKGNFGHHQGGITKVALVLDTYPETKDMIDWMYAPSKSDSRTYNTGGDMNKVLIETIRRDGMNFESASYHDYGISNLINIGEDFSRYAAIKRANGEKNPLDRPPLFEHPKYLQMVTSHQSQFLIRRGTKTVGDANKALQYGVFPNVESLKKTYYYIKDSEDPELKAKSIMIAQHVYMLLQLNSNLSLRYDALKKNPESFKDELEDIVAEYGEYDYDKSFILTGFGLGAIKGGTLYKTKPEDGLIDTQRDFTLNFSGMWGHCHRDYLDLGMEAYGTGLVTDLGYPEVATGDHGNTPQWIHATISHNLVLVDEKNQNKSKFTQVPLHFDAKDTKVKVIDATAPDAYEECDEYRRTIVMVDYDDEVSYGVDFFRVDGGSDHNYMFMPTSMTRPELSDNIKDKFIAQIGGTYAGPDVEFGDDPNFVEDQKAELKYPRGYTWLYDVEKAENTGENAFWFDYDINDIRKNSRNQNLDIRLRVTALNDFAPEEIALMSAPPQREAVNLAIDHLEKVMIRRKSTTGLDSLFTAVYEPYETGKKYIESIAAENVIGDRNEEVMKVTAIDGKTGTDDVAKAVRVEINDPIKGVKRTDYVVYATNGDVTYKVEDVQKGYSFEFRGFVGVWTLNEEGKPIYSYVNDGEFIGDANVKTNANRDAKIEGTVIDFQKELSLDNWVKVRFDRDLTAGEAESLVDRLINIDLDNIIENRSHPGNASFKIEGVTFDMETPNEAILDIGSTSLISSFEDANNEALGYAYDTSVDDVFEITMSYEETYSPTPEAEKPIVGEEKFETLKEAIDAAKQNETYVTIPAKTTDKTASVNITKENIEAATEIEAINIKTDFGDITFDSDAIGNINAAVSVFGNVESVKAAISELKEGNTTVVSNLIKQGIKVYDITLTADNGETLGGEFNKNGNGFATVRLPKGSIEKPVVYHIDENGVKKRMSTSVDGEFVVFKTAHFSTYSVEGVESIFGGLLLITNMNRITQNGSEYSPIQICTGIDSLKYQKVGFIIRGERTDSGAYEIQKETKTVYNSLTVTRSNGTEKKYLPSDLGANYMYGNRVLFPSATWTNANTTLYITPFAVDMNGETILGTKVKVNEEILSANGKHLFK